MVIGNKSGIVTFRAGTFSEPLVFKDIYFLERTSFEIKLCPCFDIAFAQLGLIPRTKNKFVEIVAIGDCYLIAIHVKNKKSKKQPFRICLLVTLVDGRMSMKKEKFLRT